VFDPGQQQQSHRAKTVDSDYRMTSRPDPAIDVAFVYADRTCFLPGLRGL
jgi:hypothetical protein